MVTRDETAAVTATKIARQQRIRMHRFAMAAATYGLFLIGLAAFVQMDLVSFSPLRWTLLLASCAVINLAFWSIFRTGFNMRFADPSLTGPQMVVCGWWGLILLDALPERHRAIPLMLYLGGVIFGILQLSTREYLRTVALIMFGYAALLTYELKIGKTDFHLGYELLLFTLYGMLLVWLSFFGGFVSGLKREIKIRNAELKVANEMNRRHAITDDLTELSNRRHAMEVLHRMMAFAERFGLPLSVAILDIDHFKTINDRFGHVVGDTVLRDFSRWLREILRACDVILTVDNRPDLHNECSDPLVARFGGEEFVIFLPGTNLKTTQACLERMRNNATVSVASERISFSAGIASYRIGETVESLLARADQGLYEAKNAGRDQVRTVETAVP